MHLSVLSSPIHAAAAFRGEVAASIATAGDHGDDGSRRGEVPASAVTRLGVPGLPPTLLADPGAPSVEVSVPMGLAGREALSAPEASAAVLGERLVSSPTAAAAADLNPDLDPGSDPGSGSGSGSAAGRGCDTGCMEY